nr:hypothetical protein [Parafrankia sp. CH37]
MQPLSQAEAVARAELVQVRSYDVDLDLTGVPDGPRFTSTTTVSFTCRVPGASTFVDVKAVSLDLVRLNGRELDASPAPDGRLVLTDLDVENTLVVRATMACTNTGEGLHRFTDSEDGEVYLYAQSFLDDAARIFACFDQPDLKAPLRLAVSAPGGWEVRANGAGKQVAPGRWEFEPTAPLATYVVSLVAGPYQVWNRTHDEVPWRCCAAGRSRPSWRRRRRRSSRSPPSALIITTSCSAFAIRSESTTRRSCPSSTWARWRIRAWSSSATSWCSGPR